ncbi:MAG: aminotransferase [Pseudomonadota bacterium]|nr:aminotransferase [Pseudomonadota bacterium]
MIPLGEVDPPPAPLRQAIADTALNMAEAHLYGPDLGLPTLRAEVAASVSRTYNGTVSADQVAITSGCNQAFCATMVSLCGEGDEVILPTPWYFNHKMWLDMSGVKTVPLACGEGMLPDPAKAEALITNRTKALVLVSPNNPCGVEYPAALIAQFRDLARKHGLPLVIDETYRDFHSQTGAPHDLFEDQEWGDTVIQLYSFSKAYRLTGHRVGAMVASPKRLAEAEKFIDTVTICPNQLAQHAALWGMQNLGDWLSGERLEILDRRAAIEEGFAVLAAQGWRLLGCGAYFAYVEHPFDIASDQLAKSMVKDIGVLALPGTMFMPDGDAEGRKQLRIAFANVDRAGIAALFDRLATLADLVPGHASA